MANSLEVANYNSTGSWARTKTIVGKSSIYQINEVIPTSYSELTNVIDGMEGGKCQELLRGGSANSLLYTAKSTL